MNSSFTFTSTDVATVGEIAKVLKVSPNTVYYWVSRKEIPFKRVGKHLRFNLKKVLNHFELSHQDDETKEQSL